MSIGDNPVFPKMPNLSYFMNESNLDSVRMNTKRSVVPIKVLLKNFIRNYLLLI